MPTRDRGEAGAGDVVPRHAVDRRRVDLRAGAGALVGCVAVEDAVLRHEHVA